MSKIMPSFALRRSKSVKDPTETLLDEPAWIFVNCVLRPTQLNKLSSRLDFETGGRLKVRISGPSDDVEHVRTLCIGKPFITKIFRIPDQYENNGESFVNLLRNKHSDLVDNKVYLRVAHDPLYCELIGSQNDVTEFIVAAGNMAVTGNKSDQPVAGACAAVTGTSCYSAGPRFESKLLKLAVVVINGDILTEKCDVIVCPSNNLGSPNAGAGKFIIQAAGKHVADECRSFIAQRGEIGVTGVFLTTPGNLGQSGVKFILHTCGPYLDSSKPDRSMDLLTQTIFNCLLCANDKAQVKCIALPTLGAGNAGFSVSRVSEAAIRAIEQLETKLTERPVYLKTVKFVDVNSSASDVLRSAFSRYFSTSQPHSSPLQRQLSSASSSLPTAGNTTAAAAATISFATSPTSNVVAASVGHVTKGGGLSSPRITSNVVVQIETSAEIGTSSSSDVNSTPVDVTNGTKSSTSVAATASAATAAAADDAQNANNCPICMDTIHKEKKLDCGHVFCEKCIDDCFEKHQPRCPSCGKIFGKFKGDRLNGQLMSSTKWGTSLAGYDGYATIVITYTIPGGVKDGIHYSGTTRTAYLPDTAEGQTVAVLLREAFDLGLVFTIGRSTTTGSDQVITWNDIHHKTEQTGTYGYPDATYLKRVRDELAAKGIGIDTPAVAAAVTTTTTTASPAAAAAAATVPKKGTQNASNNACILS